MIDLPRVVRRLSLAVAVVACLLPAGMAQASDTVRATPDQTARLLFVAGDVRRLSRTPSGTVDTVLEKVLQQRYRDEPSLAPEDAEREIEALHDTLASDGAATSARHARHRCRATSACWRSSPACGARTRRRASGARSRASPTRR